MNEIRDLFPGRMRERTFQLKARRDAGAVWHEPQFVECKQCGRRATRTVCTPRTGVPRQPHPRRGFQLKGVRHPAGYRISFMVFCLRRVR